VAEITPRIRVAIADDHQILRDGLRRLLESEPRFEVVAEASDGVEAIRVAKEVRPDVLLLDVAMPRMGGVEVLSALEASPTKIVLLTAGIDAADLLRAVQLGARGVILKESATRVLIDGIYRVIDGKYVIGAGVADDLAQAVRQVAAPAVPKHSLTTRELEILSSIVQGASNRDIAEGLGISLQTVKHHLTNIFDKTGASSRLELALMAIRQGIVEPD
jgi:two-component system, NarL family, nitrate/nitrite response regulator NarL